MLQVESTLVCFYTILHYKMLQVESTLVCFYTILHYKYHLAYAFLCELKQVCSSDINTIYKDGQD